jgi:hypothetical protein
MPHDALVLATVERLDDADSNPYSPRSWSSGEVELRDPDRLGIRGGTTPPVSVSVELCGATFDRSGDFVLDVDDGSGCRPQVVFDEDVNECDDCDSIGDLLVDVIFDAIIGRQHRWGSRGGTVTVRNDGAGVATVSIAADMEPRGVGFGENTARGTFELRVEAVLTELGP